MKRTMILALFLAFPMFASAPPTSISGAAAIGAGFAYSYDKGTEQITWQTKFTGTPTAITVNLEGSIDEGLTWAILDSSTSTTGEMRHVVNKLVKRLRCNIAAYTVNGSTATCQFVVKEF